MESLTDRYRLFISSAVIFCSPHPVKPMATEEKRSEGRSVLEKLKSTISPGRSSQVLEQETNRKKVTYTSVETTIPLHDQYKVI